MLWGLPFLSDVLKYKHVESSTTLRCQANEQRKPSSARHRSGLVVVCSHQRTARRVDGQSTIYLRMGSAISVRVSVF